MNTMRAFSLRFTLVAAFTIMIMISAAIGAIGILGMRRIVAAHPVLYKDRTLPLIYLEKITENFQRIRVNLHRIGTGGE
ncbi:MAG: MCP four helix bundle domain-containing protein [Treponemataceae bacterium]